MAPTICIGLAGHSGAGKSALLQALLDNEFDLANGGARRSTETLEFAHAKIYKCNSSGRTRASCYRSCSDLLDMQNNDCETPVHAMARLSLSRRAGFVDCPGNELFVATILKGIMMSDGVLILSRPTEALASSTTELALAAASMMGRSIVVVQIIKSAADHERIEEHKKEIRKCIKQLQLMNYSGDEVPIMKISASAVLEGIGDVCRRMIGMRPVTQPRGGQGGASSSSSSGPPPALMLIASTCLVDPLGPEEDAVRLAAAAGDATMFVKIVGRVVQGLVSASDEVEVRPGIMTKGNNGRMVYQPITLTVTSVVHPAPAAAAQQEEGQGDGLVELRASATIVNVDANRKLLRLVGCILGGDDGGAGGHLLGHPAENFPRVYDALKMNVLLLPRMTDPYTGKVHDPLPKLELEQKLLLIIGTMATCGTVKEVWGHKGRASTIVLAGLSPPTCASSEESILVCRYHTLSWHLIGSGTIVGGRALTMVRQV